MLSSFLEPTGKREEYFIRTYTGYNLHICIVSIVSILIYVIVFMYHAAITLPTIECCHLLPSHCEQRLTTFIPKPPTQMITNAGMSFAENGSRATRGILCGDFSKVGPPQIPFTQIMIIFVICILLILFSIFRDANLSFQWLSFFSVAIKTRLLDARKAGNYGIRCPTWASQSTRSP